MIDTTANKYGSKKMDTWNPSQATSVGSHQRIIKATPTIQGMKQDSVTAGAYSSQLRKGEPITTGPSKLVATSSYGKLGKQA